MDKNSAARAEELPRQGHTPGAKGWTAGGRHLTHTPTGDTTDARDPGWGVPRAQVHKQGKWRETGKTQACQPAPEGPTFPVVRGSLWTASRRGQLLERALGRMGTVTPGRWAARGRVWAQESQRGEPETDQKELDSTQGGEKGTVSTGPRGRDSGGVHRATSGVEGTASRLGAAAPGTGRGGGTRQLRPLCQTLLRA